MGDCGCKVWREFDKDGLLQRDRIEYCPLHASAEKMLVALKSCIGQIEALASRDDVPDGSREAVTAAEGK